MFARGDKNAPRIPPPGAPPKHTPTQAVRTLTHECHMVGTGEATNGPEFSDVTGPGDVLPVTDRADPVRDDRARAKRDISKCLELQSFFAGSACALA